MIRNRFEFIGKLDIRKETEKFKPHEIVNYDSGWTKEKLMLNVIAKDSSMLIEVSDMFSNKSGFKFKKQGVGTKNEDGSWTKGSDIEIPWKDRLNQSIIDQIANYQKYIVDFSNNKERYDLRKLIKTIENEEGNITEEDMNAALEEAQNLHNTKDINELKHKLEELESMKHEFLNRIDMIKLLIEEIPKHPNMIFKATGDITYSQSPKDNRVYRTFMTNKIEKAVAGDKQLLKGELDVFFNDISLNEDTFEETKKYIMNVYIKTYDGQLKQEIYVPQTLVMDASRLDLENKKHKAKIDFLVNPFRDCDEDIIYELQYNVKFARGAERKEITMDDLTDFQRQCVECGNRTFEEVKKELGGDTFGDRVDETRIIGVNIKDFPNGRIETNLELKDMLVDKMSLLSNEKDTSSTNDTDIEENENNDDMEDLL